MERPLRLTILVYEPDESARAAIREALTYFAIHRNFDLRVDWMFRADQEREIPRILPDTLIALVNAEMGERSGVAGRLIYDANPDCLLVYYGNGKTDLAPLLAARPMAYNPAPKSAQMWDKVLYELSERITNAGGYFNWSGKDHRYRLPYRSIAHIRSERVHLDIFTVFGAAFRMVGKLDEAAKQLPPRTFLRIHQSELVNLEHVRELDRSRRCLIMADGSELYISRAHYKDVVMRFDDI